MVLHPAVLLLKGSTHFGLAEVLFPVRSPAQPTLNILGAASWYGLLIVILTSLFRLHIARPLWRKLHYLVFPSFALMFIHSVFADTLLSTGRVDLLDGGKLFVEVCFVISMAAWTMRIRLRGRGFRPQAVLQFRKDVR